LLQQNGATYGQSWWHALALGIAAHDQGAYKEAKEAYAISLQLKPTWLAWRQMALIQTHPSTQKEAYFQALNMPDAPSQLYVEIATFLTAIKDFSELKRFINSLPSQMLTYERIRIAHAHIAAIEKDWPQLAELLDFPFASIREGETILHELWFSMQKANFSDLNSRGAINSTWQQWVAAHALPSHLDFRLSSAELAFEKIFSWD
jgi:tetratricopeptide (TPR) repeat protein